MSLPDILKQLKADNVEMINEREELEKLSESQRVIEEKLNQLQLFTVSLAESVQRQGRVIGARLAQVTSLIDRNGQTLAALEGMISCQSSVTPPRTYAQVARTPPVQQTPRRGNKGSQIFE